MGSQHRLIEMAPSRVFSRGGDVFTCDPDTRARILARNVTPLDAEKQRNLLTDRIFPRGDNIKDSEGRIRISPLLHARMRRELLEDLYGLRSLAPARMAELMEE